MHVMYVFIHSFVYNLYRHWKLLIQTSQDTVYHWRTVRILAVTVPLGVLAKKSSPDLFVFFVLQDCKIFVFPFISVILYALLYSDMYFIKTADQIKLITVKSYLYMLEVDLAT